MTIKHIIFPGGGPIGFFVYGALKRLHYCNFWNIKNIESIYCTSIGGLLGIITILDLNWNWIDDFLIKRPWNKIIDINNINYLKILSEKGIFDLIIAKNIIDPLLKSKGLDSEITLEQFYNFSNISIYFCSTNINSNILEEEIISHKNYPNMKLYEALYCTLNIPFIFKPYFYHNKCLIDGGLINNNPIKNCLENENCADDEFLFFTNSNDLKENVITEESNIFNLLLLILSKMAVTIMFRNLEFEKKKKIKNIIHCNTNNGALNLSYWLEILNSQEERISLIDEGTILADKFLMEKYPTFYDTNIPKFDSSLNKIIDISNNFSDLSNNNYI